MTTTIHDSLTCTTDNGQPCEMCRWANESPYATQSPSATDCDDNQRPPVTIVKCQCGQSGCDRYGLSEGMFYQGCGWSKERAEQIAAAINDYDSQHRITSISRW